MMSFKMEINFEVGTQFCLEVNVARFKTLKNPFDIGHLSS